MKFGFTCWFVFLSLIVTQRVMAQGHLDIFPDLDNPKLMEQKIPVTDLRKDVDAFLLGALARHPDMKKYANLDELRQTASDLKSMIVEPMTRLEFFRIVSQLSHKFGDGHSFLIWPYQEYNKLVSDGAQVFPFKIHLDKADRMWLKESYYLDDEKSIMAGTEILAINGIEADQLIATMQKLVGGETLYLRKQFVADRFAIYLWAAFDMVNEFEIVIQKADGSVETILVGQKTTVQQITKEASSDLPSDFDFRMIAEGVGYLKVASFDIDPDWFEDYLNETFEEINSQNIHALIIDVRENTGGNTDAPLYLTRFIAKQKFRMASKVIEKLNDHNRGFFNYKGDVGEMLVEEWDDWEKPHSDRKRFKGDAYVLISPITYSAGIVFASTVKDFGFATLLGQETGGNANQTAQGNLFNLPHSQLRAYIATRMIVRPSGAETAGGVKPDVVVEITRDSLQEGRDNVLDRTLMLIKQNKAGE